MNIHYVTILRALSTIAVVAIHVSGPLLSQWGQSTAWWTGNIVDGLARWSVPIFVMISGMLLLSSKKKESISTFMSRRAIKVFIPFIFWTFVYLIWKNKSNLLSVDVTQMIREVLEGQVYIHLWFLYMIMGLYLVTPIIRLIAKQENVKEIKYFVSVWFLVVSVYGVFRYFLSVPIGLKVEFFTGYLGYFLLGYLLGNIHLSKKAKSILYILGVVSAFITIAGTYVLSNMKGDFDGYFYEYLSPNTILISAAIFVFFKEINWQGFIERNKSLYHVLEKLSIASFGIYLVHLLVIGILGSNQMEQLIGFKINASTVNPIIGIGVSMILVIAISYVITMTMKKLPVLKKFVP